MKSYSFINYSKNQYVATIEFNRPEIHNAFNDEMIAEVTDALEIANSDDELGLIVLKALGKSFCAGADLNWMKSMIDYSFEENVQDSVKLANMFKAIDQSKLPTLAICQGHALGGGVGVIASCDYVLSADHAKFGLTEVRLGLIPAVISPFVINKIGVSRARAYFMSGSRFSAKTAFDMGLVHEVVASAEVENRSRELINEFLSAAPKAAIIAKDLIEQVCTLEDEQAITAYTTQLIANQRVSEEGQEGMKALLDKRKSNWSRI